MIVFRQTLAVLLKIVSLSAAGVNNPANLAETMASFGQDATSGDNAIHYSDTATLMEMMNQQLQQQAAFNETLLLPNKRKDGNYTTIIFY